MSVVLGFLPGSLQDNPGVLVEHFENATDGVKGLLDETPSKLTGFKASVASKAADMKTESATAAALISTAEAAQAATSKDAQEEAIRHNAFRLNVAGTKEQMVKEITAVAGTNTTNLILRHADGVGFKKVDKHPLHQLVAAVMEGAKRPDPVAIRKQIAIIMVFALDCRGTGATS